MAKKNFNNSGIVYSTDKGFKFAEEKISSDTINPSDQKLKVRLDTKQRGGKAVTIVDGFAGTGIEEAGRQMKVYCGTGGSVKDGQIIIQGDNRDKVIQWLAKNGYTNAKKI